MVQKVAGQAPRAPGRSTVLLVAVLVAWSCGQTTAFADPEPTAPVSAADDGGFDFGSYGRVPVGSDLRGRSGRQVRLVAFPPRLLEAPYAELDLGYTHVSDGAGRFHTHITLAMAEPLFHETGDFAVQMAVRNLYAEASDLLADGLDLWAGSRMARGDDLYLLDVWPLDELNVVGGGASWRIGDLRFSGVVGFNRLNDGYQQQTVAVPAEVPGTRDVLYLDRQRTVFGGRGEYHVDLGGAWGSKSVLYAEGQVLPSGRLVDDRFEEEYLPDDHGWLVGAEVAVYERETRNHANLFVRYAAGLAAYDELGVPFGLDSEKRAAGADELRVGASANLEVADSLGLLFGGLARYFQDADPNVFDRDDVWEVSAALRPSWFLTDHFQLVGEANLQYQRPNGLSPESQRQDTPLAVELGLMPTVSWERGSYGRPQLRLIYAVTMLDDAALRTFPQADPQRAHATRHFLGLGVEWWFNSTSYR